MLLEQSQQLSAAGSDCSSLTQVLICTKARYCAVAKEVLGPPELCGLTRHCRV